MKAQKRGPARLGILIASLEAGGAERAALGLLDGFGSAGFDPFLIALDGNREMLDAVEAGRREALSRRIVHLTGADVSRGTLAKTLAAPVQWLRLYRLLRARRPQVVLSIMERANIMNLMMPAGSRRIISIRSYPTLLFDSKTAAKRQLVKRSYALLLRRADHIVFVSREAAMDFERLFPGSADRSTVIYNPCDAERIRAQARQPVPAEFEPIFEQPVVIACGRLNAEKGHHALIRAFSEVARQDPRVRLVVLGSGRMERVLRDLRDALGLRERVFLPGFQPNPLAWMARAAVYVLPSAWEGFPNSLLEALAVGVPAVSSDCSSGPRELLVPESDPRQKTTGVERTPLGFLVPAPDAALRDAAEPLHGAEQAMARAILRALEDRQWREAYAPAARERASDFTPERILSRWLRLIATL